MIAVSDAWKEVQKRFLLPEMFVEVVCAITENGAQETATAAGTNEEIFSQVEVVTGNTETTTTTRYATFEQNLWVLDGTRNILPTEEPYPNIGYVSANSSGGKVILSFDAVREVAVPGVTIVWSSEYGEYPTRFSVTAKNGDTVVASMTVDNNTSNKTLVDLELVNYDSVEVEVHEWCLPYHRSRIDQVSVGHLLPFTKNEIIRYTHEQSGDLNSGELIKHCISFSVDNRDGRWNPNNPSGIERYLSERQRVTVRYGLDIGDTTEWHTAGVFYLSEWSAPANGLEASFVARDVFEYMLNEPYIMTGYSDSLRNHIRWAFGTTGVPTGTLFDDLYHDDGQSPLHEYVATITGDYTAAQVVQMCANAAGCVIEYWPNGITRVGQFRDYLMESQMGDYRITSALSYSHPEVMLAKPLRSVSVSYGDKQTYVLDVSPSGEIQTVNNPLVATEEQAAMIAEWVRDTLLSRKTVSGEFRADPRLQVFDTVTVESKYGDISPVVITNIKYSFNGSFKASYSGRVISKTMPVAES